MRSSPPLFLISLLCIALTSEAFPPPNCGDTSWLDRFQKPKSAAEVNQRLIQRLDKSVRKLGINKSKLEVLSRSSETQSNTRKLEQLASQLQARREKASDGEIASIEKVRILLGLYKSEAYAVKVNSDVLIEAERLTNRASALAKIAEDWKRDFLSNHSTDLNINGRIDELCPTIAAIEDLDRLIVSSMAEKMPYSFAQFTATDHEVANFIAKGDLPFSTPKEEISIKGFINALIEKGGLK